MDDEAFDVHEFVMVHCSKDEIFENLDGFGKDELKGVLQRWQANTTNDLEEVIEFRYAEEVRTRTRRQLLLVYFIYLLTNHEQFQA